MKHTNTQTLSAKVNGLWLDATFEGKPKTNAAPHGDIDYHIIHDHVNYEVFLPTDGHIELITEKEKRVYEGTALIIPPRKRHFTVIHGNAVTFFLSAARQSDALLLHRLRARADHDGAFEIRMTEALLANTAGLISAMQSSTACARTRGAAYLTLILSDITEALGVFDRNEDRTEAPPAYFPIIESFINAHYKDEGGITALAEALHLSTRQTQRVVYGLYGETLTAVIRSKRMAVAAILLKNTDKPVSAVAIEAGYANEGRFYDAFKRHFSMTPLTYRKIYRE